MIPGAGYRWLHRISLMLHIIVALAASGVIAACLYLLGIFILNPANAEGWTVGMRPSLFYADINPDEKIFPAAVYASVLGVAHNSGGSLDGVVEALISGADIIEVDVSEFDGELYSSHTPPLPFLGERLFRGPSLARIWTASYGAEAMMLDLKGSSQSFVNLVGEFLSTRALFRTVIVSSPYVSVLRAVKASVPSAILLLSVGDQTTLDNLTRDDAARSAIDGVTIRQTLLNEDSIAWLHTHDLLIFAWTVNTLPRTNELIAWEVDSITTDNLGILALLSGDDPATSVLPKPGSSLTPP